MGNKRVYETFDAALARFRLMPEQFCDNPFIVEFIGRHSLRRADDGWVWKFDSEAMGSRRFGEPVREYLRVFASGGHCHGNGVAREWLIG